MKLEMNASPLPPSFPFPPPFLPHPSLWGLGSTQDNAQSWDANSGQSSREAATCRAGALPWEVGWLSLSAGGQESQDEAMSDGWNHAGRSVRQESRVRGGEQGKAPGHRAPYSLGALTWGRTSAAGGWAAVAGSFSCFWDGQQKKPKNQSQGPRENGGRCGQTDTEHVRGDKGDRERMCERFRI